VRLERLWTVMRTAKRRPRIQPTCIPLGPADPSPHKLLSGPLSTPLRAAKERVTVCVSAPQPLPSVTMSVIAPTASRFIFSRRRHSRSLVAASSHKSNHVYKARHLYGPDPLPAKPQSLVRQGPARHQTFLSPFRQKATAAPRPSLIGWR